MRAARLRAAGWTVTTLPRSEVTVWPPAPGARVTIRSPVWKVCPSTFSSGPASFPAVAIAWRARVLTAVTLARRQAYVAASCPAETSAAQELTIWSRARSRSAATRIRSVWEYQSTAASTSPARSSASAARSAGSAWRTFSSRLCTAWL